MSVYLQRYQAGECTQVWEELIALAEGVRETTIHEDACAVAHETMQRARRNVEKLDQRLRDIGYRFECEKARVMPTPLEDWPPGVEASGAGFLLDVAPDQFHKAGFSGDVYSIVLPDASADVYLHGTDTYLIAYLRKSFLWGGFPGLENDETRDDELIACLREGLEPI